MQSVTWFNWRYKTGQMFRRGAHDGDVGQSRFAVVAALLIMTCAVSVGVVQARAEGSAQGHGSSEAGPKSGADGAPTAQGREARPEHDADASDLARPGGPPPRPRPFGDGDNTPRSDEGCPYRGRKLDLIV